MKGLVFKEFMNMVEDKFGTEILESIIDDSHLESGGAYTSVGTYNHEEILRLVESLSRQTKIPSAELVKEFGRTLIPIFAKGFPSFFVVKNTFTFLKSLNDYIHVEVKKLYPDAELPVFVSKSENDSELVLEYQSSRPLADLAEGLIEGLIRYNQESIEVITKNPLEPPTSRTFLLKRG